MVTCDFANVLCEVLLNQEWNTIIHSVRDYAITGAPELFERGFNSFVFLIVIDELFYVLKFFISASAWEDRQSTFFLPIIICALLRRKEVIPSYVGKHIINKLRPLPWWTKLNLYKLIKIQKCPMISLF